MLSNRTIGAFLTGVILLATGAMGASPPEVRGGTAHSVPLDPALFAAIVEHVRDEHLEARSFLVWTAVGVDASGLTEQARTLGAAGLMEQRSGSGSRCEAERRRCRVDGAESILRINALEVQTGSTTVRIFVGHSIEGTGGPSVRGAARELTLEARGEVWEVTADTVLFAT